VQNTRRVDDKAYGMHGQVICPEPLANCLEDLFAKIGKKVPVVFLSPSGDLMNQEKMEGYVEKF
jgi:tRNA G37 N-methylase TrmD